MLLTYGDTRKLKGTKWYMLEIRSDTAIEGTVKRLCKELPGIMRENPSEIFVLDDADALE